MRSLALLAALAALLAGCVQPEALVPAGDVDVGGNGSAGGNASTGGGSAPAGGGRAPAEGGNSTGDAPDGNATSPTPRGPPIEWPDPESAPVRPGVQVVTPDGSQCTSNFVFTSLDNATIYLGLAAHCVYGMALGDPLDVDGGTAGGTLAYSSWLHTGHNEPNSPAGDVCTDETDAAVCAFNDFALVRIDDADRGLVHPAMKRFGGPTGLAPAGTASTGDKVLTFGNSGLRAGLEATSPHEGVVLFGDDGWTTTIYTATPGVPGDSGSGVMLGDGSALGVLVTIGLTPYPASNGVSTLETLLAWMTERTGMEVQLATWELLDPGLLPLS